MHLPLGLDLEEGHRLPRTDQLVDTRVIEGEGLKIDLDAFVTMDQGGAFAQAGHHAQTEDVEFHQPHGFDVFFVEGDHLHAIGRNLNRGEMGEGFARQDHAAGVQAEVAGAQVQIGDTFQEQVYQWCVAEDTLNGFAVFGDFIGQTGGHGLRQGVDFGHGPTEGFGHIAQGESQFVGDQRRRHRRLFDAEASLHPVDDLVAAVGVKVDVDVGGAFAFAVQEAFEEQVVANGVDGGDAQQKGDDAVGCRAASGATDAPLTCDGNDFVHDEEEFLQLQIGDDLQFTIVLCLSRGALVRSVEVLQAGIAQFSQVAPRRFSCGDDRRRRCDVFGHEIDTTGFGDLHSAIKGVRVRQQTSQLRFGLQIRFGVARTFSVGLADADVESGAGEQIVATPICGCGESHVVGDDGGQLFGARQMMQTGGDSAVFGQ